MTSDELRKMSLNEALQIEMLTQLQTTLHVLTKCTESATYNNSLKALNVQLQGVRDFMGENKLYRQLIQTDKDVTWFITFSEQRDFLRKAFLTIIELIADKAPVEKVKEAAQKALKPLKEVITVLEKKK
jgi:hypothetical protein